MNDLPRRVERLGVCLVVASTDVQVHGLLLPAPGEGGVLCSGATRQTTCYGLPLIQQDCRWINVTQFESYLGVLTLSDDVEDVLS